MANKEKNLIIVDGKFETHTEYEYEIGEIIKLSWSPIKCVGKETKDGVIHHKFIRPRMVWDQ